MGPGAWGSGTLTYQWQQGEDDIPGADAETYDIASAQPADDGAVFHCTATNSGGSTTSADATLHVSALAITTMGIPAALSGAAYSFTLEGDGGQLPYTWTVTAGTPPANLALTAAGELQGTSSDVSSEAITIQLEDNLGATTTKDFTLAVVEPAITIAMAAPFDGGFVMTNTGEPLTVQLTASGGAPPYTYSIVYGTLPEGLVLDTATGEITGTPSVGCDTNVLIGVEDNAVRRNMEVFTFWVSPHLPGMPSLTNILTVYDAGVIRMAYVIECDVALASVTVDARFHNSLYPVRLEAFSPPTFPAFLTAAGSLGANEELWELPGIEGRAELRTRILTDVLGRSTVLSSDGGSPVGSGWIDHDLDADGVPDECDDVDGNDPSAQITIRKDTALRQADDSSDITPPVLDYIRMESAGPPALNGSRSTYKFQDESFIAGGEVEIVFTDSSPAQTVMVPLVFQGMLQNTNNLATSTALGELWALPFIPCDYLRGGTRVWDRWGNCFQQGFGIYRFEPVTPQTVVPVTDTDSDGIEDSWELAHFATIAACDPMVDSDGDTFDNETEYRLGSNPQDAQSVPATADDDADGVPNLFDPDDANNVVDTYQHFSDSQLTNHDTDGDGMPDIWEAMNALDASSPADAALDGDGDGRTNADEFAQGSDPHMTDSDGDGILDGADGPTATSGSMDNVTWSVYTPEREVATSDPTYGYSGVCSVVSPVQSTYGVAWAKVLVRLQPSGELILVDTTSVADPTSYGMWWAIEGTVVTTGPVGEYFEGEGYIVADTTGLITVE